MKRSTFAIVCTLMLMAVVAVTFLAPTPSAHAGGKGIMEESGAYYQERMGKSSSKKAPPSRPKVSEEYYYERQTSSSTTNTSGGNWVSNEKCPGGDCGRWDGRNPPPGFVTERSNVAQEGKWTLAIMPGRFAAQIWEGNDGKRKYNIFFPSKLALDDWLANPRPSLNEIERAVESCEWGSASVGKGQKWVNLK